MVMLVFHVVIVTVCIGHILLRRHRQPESRMAWLVVVLAMPSIGARARGLSQVTNDKRRADPD
ncbi:MAG: PLDc N-terminal domain-containing protein [Candidatus Competibacteraceae bacterium]|nr:PLDc N-terminal domain-containing protein [Candidatus Competibacteraceae bacterium]